MAKNKIHCANDIDASCNMTIKTFQFMVASPAAAAAEACPSAGAGEVALAGVVLAGEAWVAEAWAAEAWAVEDTSAADLPVSVQVEAAAGTREPAVTIVTPEAVEEEEEEVKGVVKDLGEATTTMALASLEVAEAEKLQAST